MKTLPDKFQICVENKEELNEILAAGYEWPSDYVSSGNLPTYFPVYILFGYLGSSNITYNDIHYVYGNFPLISLQEFKNMKNKENPEVEPKKYYTDYSAGTWAMAVELAADKDVRVDEYPSQNSIRLMGGMIIGGSSTIEVIKRYAKDHKYLPPLEFLAKIQNLPEKQKKITIKGLPWTVEIEGEVVRIGCQTTHLVKFKDILEKIEYNKGTQLHTYKIDPRRDGIHVSGIVILWEDWDKFVAELKEKIRG